MAVNINGTRRATLSNGTTEAPILDLNGGGAGTSETLAYIENQTARKITPSATISDVDSANFGGGVLTLTFTANGTDDDRLVVIDQGFGQGRYFVSENQIYYDFGTGVDGDGLPILDPRVIGTFTGGTSGSAPLVITLTADATVSVTQGLLRQIGYYNVSDTPVAGSRTVSYTLSDGDGNIGLAATATIQVTAVSDTVANDDSFFTDENVPVSGNVFDENGNGADFDPEGSTLTVTAVNGAAANVGNQIILASGARLILNPDGSFSYDPNGKFNSLVPVESGAANVFAIDSFTYTLNGADTATVTIGLNGIVSSGDIYKGDSDDNVITGTAAPDFVLASQGGIDNVSGLGGNDVVLFGATLTSADSADGGIGTDQAVIQGDYSAGVTLGTGFVGFESFAILPGSDIRFGDPGTNFYDYNITTVEANVAAGVLMVVDANRLRVGEDFTFNGSAETDGSFFIYGGGGTDNLLGGSKNDTFYFGENLQFGATDHVDGGVAGTDQLGLRGNYTIVFGANQLISIESIGLVSALDTRFGGLGTAYNYNLTMNDGNVAAGVRMTVDAAPLRGAETLTFDGSAEVDGSFRIFGGQGNDTIKGSQGNDLITGGTGADNLYGSGGNDIFNYRTVAESTSASRDTIHDFSLGDLLNLSQIDAISGTPGNDSFNFIGSGAFSNTAGELRATLAGGNWTVQGDVNGDGIADIEIIVVVTDAHPIGGGDFIL